MKNKITLISILILLLSQYSYAQNKHEIGIIFGLSSGDLGKTALKEGFFIKGAGGHQLENSKTFGIRYFRKSSKKENRRLEIGLNYLNATLKITPAPTGEPIVISRENYNLLSVPVYINYTFWEYLYANGGIILDYQNSDSGDYDSFGAGFGFGLGAKYSFNKMNIYINPKFERHLFFNEKEGLIEYGIMFGIGYSI